MQPPASLDIRAINERSEVSRIADEVESFGVSRGLPGSVLHDLHVCIDEVFANILAHAYDDRVRHEIDIHMEVGERRVTVEIVDDGRAFDPTGAPSPGPGGAPDGRTVGGLGIYFLRRLMDHVAYERAAGTNRLVMSKDLPGSVAAGSSEPRGGAMDVAVERLGAIVRIAPRGRIDSATAEAFGVHLRDAIAGGCRRLVVDFRDVKYITSAGFRSLLVADAAMREATGNLALCGMPRDVHNLFQIGAFTEDFLILPTLEECLARLAG